MRRSLLLNADFSAIGTVSWRKAITLQSKYGCDSAKGVDVVLHYQNQFIYDTKGRKHEIPAVVRLRSYLKQQNKVAKFSRKNIYMRDKGECQYCGKTVGFDDFTYDHVIPRSRFNYNDNDTPTFWENIVVACKPCNRRKDNKTPKEAGMKLRTQPRKMMAMQYVKGVNPYNHIPTEWVDYLPKIYKELAKN
jgi:5-methylcytosine-specific restriction endonuclease McrA